MTFRKLVGEEVRWQIVQFKDNGSRSVLQAKDEDEARRRFESHQHGPTTRLVLQKVRVRKIPEDADMMKNVPLSDEPDEPGVKTLIFEAQRLASRSRYTSHIDRLVAIAIQGVEYPASEGAR